MNAPARPALTPEALSGLLTAEQQHKDKADAHYPEDHLYVDALTYDQHQGQLVDGDDNGKPGEVRHKGKAPLLPLAHHVHQASQRQLDGTHAEAELHH